MMLSYSDFKRNRLTESRDEIQDRHGKTYHVSYHSDNDRQTYRVHDPKTGEHVATALLPAKGGMAHQTYGPYVGNVDVAHEHRRRGIASSLYDHIERHQDSKLNPSPGYKSSDGRAFWSRRRPE